MVLSAAERETTSSSSTVTLTRGEYLLSSYIGNYLTCLFTVNGKKLHTAFSPRKLIPPSGSYVAQVLDSNKNEYDTH